MKKSLLTTLLCGALFPTLAMAADGMGSKDSGFYVGGNLGLTHYDEDGFFDDSALIGSSFDDDSFGLAVLGGYQVSRWLAVEAAYTFLGNYWEEGRGANDDDDIDTALSALTVSVLLDVPMGDTVSVFAQAGFGFAMVDQVLDYDDPGINIEEDEFDTGPAGVLGLGLKINLPETTGVQLRVGYQYYIFETDLYKINSSNQYVNAEVEQEVDYLYLGATYHF